MRAKSDHIIRSQISARNAALLWRHTCLARTAKAARVPVQALCKHMAPHGRLLLVIRSRTELACPGVRKQDRSSPSQRRRDRYHQSCLGTEMLPVSNEQRKSKDVLRLQLDYVYTCTLRYSLMIRADETLACLSVGCTLMNHPAPSGTQLIFACMEFAQVLQEPSNSLRRS
jgi:hypothetical protein